MALYEVTYFYLASGMEGNPDVRRYLISAESASDAIEQQILKEYPEDVFYGPGNSFSSRRFLRSCLSAKEVTPENVQTISSIVGTLHPDDLDDGEIMDEGGFKYRVYKCGFRVLIEHPPFELMNTVECKFDSDICPGELWDQCFEKMFGNYQIVEKI